ncbi:MAG: O-antigen ligase family protein [Bacilli bacterium]|nr:O-antigen ligase family protein [Bacilli bacterium]
MNKINNYIRKNLSFILTIFILLQPFLDLFVSLSLNTFVLPFNIGIVVRGLFLFFIMYVSIFLYDKKKLLVYLLVLFLYTVFYLVANINSGGFSELHGLIRVLYFPIMLFSLYSIKEEFRISNMAFVYSLFIYITLIFIANITGTSFQSYDVAKDGSIGWFNSTNEVSVIITILMPIVIIVFKGKGYLLLKIFLTLLFLLVISQIGTKTPILGLFIIFFALFIWMVIVFIKRKMYGYLAFTFMLVIVTLVSTILVVPKTTFYKNIKIHLNYLKVDSVFDVVKDSYLFDHFVFSQRITFLEDISDKYENATTMEKLFGIGYFNNSGNSYKSIEMDYYDLYYSHGIVGFIIIMGTYVYVLYRVFRSIPTKVTFDRYMGYLSLILILILSLFSGHVIVSPAVSFVCVILIINLISINKKRLMFTAYDLGVGGIESALVNLLKFIDYDKYNVDIYLEKKRGMKLNDLPDFVGVFEFKVSDNKNVLIRKMINVLRRMIFSIFNYHTYDFSCCYATYSLSGGKISRIASLNNSIYIHSNYKYVYKNDSECLEFFGKRRIFDFRKIFIVSNEAKDDFLSLYPGLEDRVLVFNNFIDIDAINELSNIKVDLAKRKDRKLFVFVGRLDDSSKKVGRIINIVKNISDIDLIIVGDGPDREKYEILVKKYKLCSRVNFVGKQSNPYPYIAMSDYLILTSVYEGFPVTFLEAIVLHKPIISTIDVSDDSINIGRDYGYIISSDDDIMIDDVRNILNNPRDIKYKDLKRIQKRRMKRLEKIFDGVI